MVQGKSKLNICSVCLNNQELNVEKSFYIYLMLVILAFIYLSHYTNPGTRRYLVEYEKEHKYNV